MLNGWVTHSFMAWDSFGKGSVSLSLHMMMGMHWMHNQCHCIVALLFDNHHQRERQRDLKTADQKIFFWNCPMNSSFQEKKKKRKTEFLHFMGSSPSHSFTQNKLAASQIWYSLCYKGLSIDDAKTGTHLTLSNGYNPNKFETHLTLSNGYNSNKSECLKIISLYWIVPSF